MHSEWFGEVVPPACIQLLVATSDTDFYVCTARCHNLAVANYWRTPVMVAEVVPKASSDRISGPPKCHSVSDQVHLDRSDKMGVASVVLQVTVLRRLGVEIPEAAETVRVGEHWKR